MKKGVLLVNLGSPASPTKKDVRKFLREFLSDRYVMNLPAVGRFLLVNLIIVPFRITHSTRLYRSVWSSEGSPLICHSLSLLEKINDKLSKNGIGIPVRLAMRYGKPDIETVVRELKDAGVEQILLIPLYPHYALSTFETVQAKVKQVLGRLRRAPGLVTVPPFYDHGDYISSLERTVRETLTGHPVDKLVFSFHGVPLSHLPCDRKTARRCNNTPWRGCIAPGGILKECYKYQCHRTAEALAERIGGDADTYEVAFQSRMGKGEWLRPYLYERLARLPGEGNKRIAVIAPSFTADCLETLHELDGEGKELFFENGGTEYLRIPCLNDHGLWAGKVAKWIGEWSEKD